MSRGRVPPNIDGLHSLKFQIDNISYNTSINDLRRLFDRYGEIGDIHIPFDKYTRQSKGFGFVRFHSRSDAEYAMDRLDGRCVDGRELRISLARYGRAVDDKGYRGGGRGRSRSPRRRSRSRSPRRYRSRSPRRSRSGSSRRSRSEARSRSRSLSKSPRNDRDRSRSRSFSAERNARGRSGSSRGDRSRSRSRSA